MQHPLELEIHDRLYSFLAKEISLHEFEEWFFPKTWGIDKLNEPSLLDLVYQIKLYWAEFSDGDLTEKDFRSMLRSLADRYSICPSSIKLIYSTSSKSAQYTSVMRSAQSVDIKSSRVYG